MQRDTKVKYYLFSSDKFPTNMRKLNWKISKIVNLLVARTRREEKCQHLFGSARRVHDYFSVLLSDDCEGLDHPFDKRFFANF